MSRRGALALALVVCAAPLAAADFDKGIDAYLKGDHAAALAEWLPLAEAGDLHAQYNIGLLYDRGQGVAADSAKANAWFRRSAEQGYAQAMDRLATQHAEGRGGAVDLVAAYVWFTRAALAFPPGGGRALAQFSRDSVAGRMTPTEVARAEAALIGWSPKRE